MSGRGGARNENRERPLPGQSDPEERELGLARRRRRILLALVVLAIGGALLWIHNGLPESVRDRGPALCAATFFGMIAGGSELLSRYRDEPLKALNSNAGILYVALNGAISAAAYGLLVRYGKHLFPGIADDELMLSVLAGFGAMAVLRSKLR